MFVGFVAAAFPDIDVISSYLSPLSYLYHHRGVTHSIVMLPLWAALLAVVFAAIWGGRPGWKAYFGVAAWGVGSHIAGDWITSFGTMLFAPFSDARYGIGTTFIIDLWFSGIIVLALAATFWWRASRLPAVLGVATLAAYVTFQWFLQQQAIEFGESYARSQALRNVRVTALPRPVSPFNWTVIIEQGEGYRYAHVNLVRHTARPQPGPDTSFIARLDAPYRPLNDARWITAERYGTRLADILLAREAYAQPNFRFFRWFAVYPSLLRIDVGNPERCVWFQDLRFVTPGREGTPFRYGMCREGDGSWQAFQLVDEGRRAVY
jgi:inner membrane protein